jgi:hypothetical protein
MTTDNDFDSTQLPAIPSANGVEPDGAVSLGSNNPMRPVDWRHLRAFRRLAPGDVWCRRYQKYRLGMRNCRSRRAFAAAEQVYEGDKSHRWKLEASLIAAIPADEIEKRLGITADALVAYRAIFFDIKPEAVSWIRHQVIGARPEDPNRPDSIRWFWMSQALQYGPEALEMVLDAVSDEDLRALGLMAYMAPEVDPDLRFLVQSLLLPAPESPGEIDRLNRLLQMNAELAAAALTPMNQDFQFPNVLPSLPGVVMELKRLQRRRPVHRRAA